MISSYDERLIIALDVGTTGVKALLITETGNIVGKVYKEYSTLTPSPVEVEQDANQWWDNSKEAIHELLKKTKPPKKSIASICVTTQRGSIVPVDSNGTPLYNAITWMDARPVKIDNEELREKLTQRTATLKILWFKQEKPDIFDNAYLFASTDAFIYYKLVKQFVMSPSCAAYYPYNVSENKISDELLELTGIPLEKMPEILPSGTNLGTLDPDVAEELGIPSSVNDILGAGDQQSAVLGVGAIYPKVAKVTTGTGTFVDVPLNEPIFEFYEKTTHMFVLPHALPNKWLLEAVIPSTGAILRWYKNNIAFPEVEKARNERRNIYDVITEEAAKVPPGSNGLGVIPLFTFGKGIIYGLSLNHTRHSIARAILESNGYAIRFFLDIISEYDVDVDELRVDGGGSKSKLWRQIKADITEKPVILTHAIEDAGALGAAILGAVGVKIYATVEDAVRNMVKIVETRKPIPENTEKYMEYYDKFQEMMLSAASEIE
ncbi:MAG: FGGY-family carbohydrate kinase [Candidatus Asgardarchaeia archaeon]